MRGASALAVLHWNLCMPVQDMIAILEFLKIFCHLEIRRVDTSAVTFIIEYSFNLEELRGGDGCLTPTADDPGDGPAAVRGAPLDQAMVKNVSERQNMAQQ